MFELNFNRMKLLVVDDHQLVRQGIVAILKENEELEDIAEASNGKEVIALLQDGLQPDIILLDYEMPELNGLQTLDWIKQHRSGIKVIFLTMREDREVIQQAIEKKVDGLLLKNNSLEELNQAILQINKGEQYFSNKAVQILATLPDNQEQKLIDLLSLRELQVLKLVAQGYSSAEIGRQLFISARTVETHRNNIMQKTNIKGTVSLVQFALKHDLLKE